MLSEKEKKEADKKKKQGDKQGKQFVENTLEAKVARKKAQGKGDSKSNGKANKGKSGAELLDEAKKKNIRGRSTMSKGELEKVLSQNQPRVNSGERSCRPTDTGAFHASGPRSNALCLAL